jgi:putative MATE family efflux protein
MPTKNIHKLSLLALTWPIFVEQLSRILPGMVDTFMVSHLGDGPVAALAVATQVVTFSIMLFSVVSIGMGVVLTHHLGAGDRDGANQVTSAALAINVWMGVLVSVLVALFARQILALLHLPPGLMPYAVPFLGLMGGTLFIEALNIALSTTLRAHGRMRGVMVIALGMNALNLALNAVLIFGLLGMPKMGVLGAALSTVISRAVACIALLWLTRRQLHFQMRLRALLHVPMATFKRIIHIGLPAAGENMCWMSSFMAITYFVGQMGEQPLAIFSYALQLAMLMMMFGRAIGVSTEIMIGHMIGAGDMDGAYRQLLRSLRTGLAITMVMTCIVVACAPQLLGLFTSNAHIIAAGASLLMINLVLEPGRTFNLIVINSLRATGDARFPVLMGACSMWGVAVPLAWLLGIHLGWGLPGVWVALTCDEWVRGLAMYGRWKSRVWEKHAHASLSHIQPA